MFFPVIFLILGTCAMGGGHKFLVCLDGVNCSPSNKAQIRDTMRGSGASDADILFALNLMDLGTLSSAVQRAKKDKLEEEVHLSSLRASKGSSSQRKEAEEWRLSRLGNVPSTNKLEGLSERAVAAEKKVQSLRTVVATKDAEIAKLRAKLSQALADREAYEKQADQALEYMREENKKLSAQLGSPTVETRRVHSPPRSQKPSPTNRLMSMLRTPFRK